MQSDPTQSDPLNDSDSSSPTTASSSPLVPVIIGFVVAVLLLSVAIFVALKWRKANDKKQQEAMSMESQATPTPSLRADDDADPIYGQTSFSNL